jgi:hypothetical protein
MTVTGRPGRAGQGDEGHWVTVAPMTADERAAAGYGDEVRIAAAFVTTSVVRLVAQATYTLAAPLTIPAGGRLYVNNAVINRALINSGAGVIPDDPPASPVYELTPGDLGVLAWTANPSYGMATTAAPAVTGRVALYMLKAGRSGTCNSISYSRSTAGTGMSNTFLGVYSFSGTLLASSADLSTQMMSTPAVQSVTVPLPPFPVNAGALYRVAFLTTCTTGPGFWASMPGQSVAFGNTGITTAQYFLIANSQLQGYAALPVTLNMNLNVQGSGYPIFVLGGT